MESKWQKLIEEIIGVALIVGGVLFKQYILALLGVLLLLKSL